MKSDAEEIAGYDRISDIIRYYKSFGDVPPETLAAAAERGQKVHDYCNLYAHNALIEIPAENCKGYVESFKKWFDLSVEKVIATEQRLYCDVLKITGRYDMIVKIKGDDGLTLVDLKTPATSCKTWPIQLAAYKYLIEKNTPHTISRTVILRLNRDGKGCQLIGYEHAGYMSLFMQMWMIHKYLSNESFFSLIKSIPCDILDLSNKCT